MAHRAQWHQRGLDKRLRGTLQRGERLEADETQRRQYGQPRVELHEPQKEPNIPVLQTLSLSLSLLMKLQASNPADEKLAGSVSL